MKALRVAAYCRVSGRDEKRTESLDNQIQHYREEVSCHPEWKLCRVYSDYGVSGYKEKRPGFDSMLADCHLGRIDMIMQKTYTKDYLNKKQVKNNGEVEQYFIRDNHPAIIDRESWERAQRMLDGMTL